MDPDCVLPAAKAIEVARASLPPHLPDPGFGLEWTNNHLLHHVLPGLNRASQSANYYGFVTGGSTPAAAFADNIVTETDQNVQVHLPNETIATDVEDRALTMLCELLDLRPETWPHRTFTTGATAGNVLGLALGRDFVLREAGKRKGLAFPVSVGLMGFPSAMKTAQMEALRILTTVPHSSLSKAASIVGLGRNCVHHLGLRDQSLCHRFDFRDLEMYLQVARIGCIVAVSCSEVNTGLFATDGPDMIKLRELCDKYGAWLHIDAAFGLMARVLPESDEFNQVRAGVAGLEHADSIAGDAHKLLNVPYDCGFFFSKHLDLAFEIFQNPNAAYLNAGTPDATTHVIPSPLNIGLENSRRFRALPVYANLVAYGRQGFQDMLIRQIRLAREIARFISQSAHYELLPEYEDRSLEERLSSVYIIVLFRARDERLNAQLVRQINASRKVYVSGTWFDGSPAARFAVANWQVDMERDIMLIRRVLDEVTRTQIA